MIKDADGRPAAGGERSPSAGPRDQGDRVWAGLYAHPFPSELAHRVLSLEKFRLFIEQDILYLSGGPRRALLRPTCRASPPVS